MVTAQVLVVAAYEVRGGSLPWSDGLERIAMLLLQAATARGPADPEQADPLLDGWSRFAVRPARRHRRPVSLIPERHIEPRLYDMPWLARFFLDRYQAQGREEDLERAARIIERRFARAGLDAAGRTARAETAA
ncbi:hypothetical protein ABZ400_32555 [Streptomyces sp. NPDC005897]|uniref:hypothetical protein n=1 Tax=Streptomyces sp. NPDC005897 TaxID=3157081 RepID=UPI00340B37E9